MTVYIEVKCRPSPNIYKFANILVYYINHYINHSNSFTSSLDLPLKFL